MENYYKIGTRRSPLALKQVEEAVLGLKFFYPDFSARVIPVDTAGDRDRVTPLTSMEGTDFFTKDIDDALLSGIIDIAIHSAKDMPDSLPAGLQVSAVTASIDPYDALVSAEGRGFTLDTLPSRARIATSSRRRKAALIGYREDLEITDIRGNVDERVRILDRGGLEGIVIAAAGLLRLGLGERISQRIPFEILSPHPLQGRLALLTRRGDTETSQIVSVLDEKKVSV